MAMRRDFWRSAGLHLVDRTDDGWLAVTPDYLRAYLTRPEIHPVEESCDAEVTLHEALLADPHAPVAPERLTRLADRDAADNYRVLLAFRDALVAAGTIEGAYMRLVRGSALAVPPVFLDQMVHLILRNILRDCSDAMELRAAEVFFRDQSVSNEDGRILLADEEIVEMHARTDRESGLAQLLAETGTPMRTVELDVLTRDNADIYWARSDRFDTVLDFRFGEPAPDAFARVVEAWLAHMMRLDVKVQPLARIDDENWHWHIGLDAEATRTLNALYEGASPPAGAMDRIVGLYRMRFDDDRGLIDRVKGRPVYLGLAMTAKKRLKMKPQNLLANLPLVATS